jgi:hypothetical protein
MALISGIGYLAVDPSYLMRCTRTSCRPVNDSWWLRPLADGSLMLLISAVLLLAVAVNYVLPRNLRGGVGAEK